MKLSPRPQGRNLKPAELRCKLGIFAWEKACKRQALNHQNLDANYGKNTQNTALNHQNLEANCDRREKWTPKKRPNGLRHPAKIAKKQKSKSKIFINPP